MYNYVGPTWAQKSFDSPDLLIEPTNFAKQWQLSYVEQVFSATPPLTIAQRVRTDLPIVWVYSDPWGNVPDITGITFEDYVSRHDWFEIWQDCNDHILRTINDLGVPVLLIGTHCDIIGANDYSNITVAHVSMQKWMAQQVGLFTDNQVCIPNEGIVIDHCFAAEIYSKFLHENPAVCGDAGLKNRLIDHWVFWKQLENDGYMFDVHPTRKSYVEFAEVLRPKLLDFLNVKQS
jgi:hypothetical protein